MEISSLHSLFIGAEGLTTDTRNVSPGKIFFALKGERFNGNEFASEALRQGAVFSVIDEKEFETDERCILVSDVLMTLQDLASYHRHQFDIPIVGITGSNGKTTTKELLRDVLAKKYKTLATKGNLNNHIGVPLTLLELNKGHEMAIIEMGANHVDEIALLSHISDPDYGLITNIGKAHIGEFGGLSNIIKGKCELYDHLKSRKGLVFVNGASTVLMEKSRTIDRVIYGEHDDSAANCQLISADPFLTFKWKGNRVETRLIGDYNLSNISASIVVGEYFGVAEEDICSAISEYHPDNNRSQLTKKGSARIIMDAYNANPDSMEVALNNLSKMSSVKKLAILGDMLELGSESNAAHRELIARVRELNIDSVFVGPEFLSLSNGASNFYPNVDAASKGLTGYDFEDTLVLIKGSRGIKLETVVDII